MSSHDWVVSGLLVFFGGIIILGLGMPKAFGHSFMAGMVVTFSAMGIMIAGLLVVLVAAMHAQRRSLGSRPRQ